MLEVPTYQIVYFGAHTKSNVQSIKQLSWWNDSILQVMLSQETYFLQLLNGQNLNRIILDYF